LKAVILGGGQGKRLRPLTESLPKPLIHVAGKPIVVRQIEWLKSNGVEEFILSIGYLREKLVNFLGNGSELGVRISYVFEDKPLGTGGGLRNARFKLDMKEDFYVVNGDIITDMKPQKLVENLKEDALGVIALVPLRSSYGIVEVDRELRILDFKEKPCLDQYWINAGLYLLRPEVLDYLPEIGDIEKTAFPKLAKEGKLMAVKYEKSCMWKSIDTHKDIEEIETELKMYEAK
jgi:glucose-1-phosphate thymidylyltransferase